jgi:D-alanine-D-alanine ligase-like ATP-grasp enzyme
MFKHQISSGGVFIEKFLAGREFTVLIVGDKNRGTKVYTPVERAFNKELEDEKRILDFDSYW